jgi:hypothetical protein
MNMKIFAATAVVFLALPFAASAQGVAGLLGVDQQPRFRAYVKHEHRSSYSYDRAVAVGAELPVAGVNYYEVPSEYGVKDYRYTIVNDQTVLVDPRTNRIVEVIQ